MKYLNIYISEKLVIDANVNKIKEIRTNKKERIDIIFEVIKRCLEKDYFFAEQSYKIEFYDESKKKTSNKEKVWFIDIKLNIGNPTKELMNEICDNIYKRIDDLIEKENICALKYLNTIRIILYDPE